MGIQRLLSFSYAPSLTAPHHLWDLHPPHTHALGCPRLLDHNPFATKFPKTPIICPLWVVPTSWYPGALTVSSALALSSHHGPSHTPPKPKVQDSRFMIWPSPNPTPHCTALGAPRSQCSNLTTVPALFWALPSCHHHGYLQGEQLFFISLPPKSATQSLLPFLVYVPPLRFTQALPFCVNMSLFTCLSCFLNYLVNSSKLGALTLLEPSVTQGRN